MNWLQPLSDGWGYLVASVTLLLSLLGSAHAWLHKRDPRAATLWVGFIGLVPLVGAVLYFVLGVNRIKRRAIVLRGHLEHFRAAQTVRLCSTEQLAASLPPPAHHLTWVALSAATVLSGPLMPGNRVDLLVNGDIAYPATPGAEAKPVLMAVCFAASTSFATPVGSQTNTMVLHPGGYCYADFMRIGIPLKLIFWALAVWFRPKYWPI